MRLIYFLYRSFFNFAYFNWIPYYYLEWHDTGSIKPIVNLFPGQKVRLEMDFYDSSPNISSAKWKIVKANEYFETEGKNPTFTLPPTIGGIYQLYVIATTSEGKIKKGNANLYVVQDKPIAIKITEPAQFKLTTINTSSVLLKDAQSKGIEVYSGNGQWIKAEKVSMTNDSIIFSLQPNESVSVYGSGNQVLFRAQDSVNKLNNYGSTPFLRDNQKMRMHDAK